MKKLKLKTKILITFGSIVALVLSFFGVVVLNGTCFETYKCTNEYSSTWMKDLDDDLLLVDTKIPGSHDACTYKMSWLAKCQNFTIDEQLELGVRYFDIRVNKKDDKYVIYHGPINGVEFDPIVNSIQNFLKNHPTETLILDFQHFNNGSEEYVFKKVNEKLLDYAVINNASLTDQEFVSKLTIKDTRGKCLILFGYGNYKEETHIFERNNDECSNSGCSLDSFYYTDLNTDSSKTYINENIPFYIDKIKEKHEEEPYKALSVLQCQLTDGALIFGPYSREKSHSKNMSNYINSLSNSSDLENINIIMRDFMNQTKVEEIYKLNFIK